MDNIFNTLPRFSHRAMATYLELWIDHSDGGYAAQAAQAAWEEVDRLEELLSRFRENSDIARLNVQPPGEWLVLGEESVDCLSECREIHEFSHGCFDITIGALVGRWRKEPPPDADELERLRDGLGMARLRIERSTFRAMRCSAAVQLDLGGYGKGYALDRVGALLEEWEVSRFLIHAGRSTVLAGEPPQGLPGWPLTLSDPAEPTLPLRHLQLRGTSVSGSGLEKGAHIIDPRSGKPAAVRRAAWAQAAQAGWSDALSTAFMLLPAETVAACCERRTDIGALLLEGEG